MKLLKIKTIKIAGKEYPFKLSVRAMIEYENMTSQSVSSLNTIEDIVRMFYCGLKAAGTDVTYDEFLNMVDDDPFIITDFISELTEEGTTDKKKQDS